MEKKYRAAIVGCGGVAHVHAFALKMLEQDIENGLVSLVACCDEKMGVAKAFGEKYGCAYYGSMKEMYDNTNPDGKIDVVHICTPHYAHAPLAAYALSRGTHVFTEKPVASTITDMQTIRNMVEKSRLNFGVCFQNRYNPSTQYAKNLIDSGESGKILGGRAFVTWHRDDNYYIGSDWRGAVNTEGAGVLINQSIHTIDLMHYLTGSKLGKPEIRGSASTRVFGGKINVEDTAEATFEFESGARIIFYATVGYSRDASITAEIHCENMTICVEGDTVRVTYPDGREESPVLSETIFMGQSGKSYWGASHGLIIDDFYRHLQRGEKFPIDAVEGGHALNAVFAILK